MQRSEAYIVTSCFHSRLLTSCSGGGGGGGGPSLSRHLRHHLHLHHPQARIATVNTSSTTPPSTSSAEYLANWGIADLGVTDAWNAGATGQGVLVAVIDDGVQVSHSELSGKVLSSSRDIDTSRNVLFDNDNTHGSELSAIIAGNVNGAATVGVAFDATILGLRADNGAGQFSTADLATAIDVAIAEGAKVINLSLGSSSPSGTLFSNALERATDAGIIVVTSAGNDGAASVNYPGALATDANVSNGLIINAGSHGTSGVISSFSNRAGSAANFYVTAPGEDIIVPDFGLAGPTDPLFQACSGDTCRVQGTSYSAPHVSAAVALLLSAFPGLTPAQVVDLLLTSAADAGAPGVDTVYGYGRLDLDAAFLPVGTVSTPLSKNGAEVSQDTPIGLTSQAFGDGLTKDAAVWQTVGFDSYDRAFPTNLTTAWVAKARPIRAQAPKLWAISANSDAMTLSYSFTLDELYAIDDQLLGPGNTFQPSIRTQIKLSKNWTSQFVVDAPLFASVMDLTSSHRNLAENQTGIRLTRKFSEGMLLSLYSEQTNNNETILREAGNQASYAARLTSHTWLGVIETAVGTVEDNSSFLGVSWTPLAGKAPNSRTSYLEFSYRTQLTKDTVIGIGAEAGHSVMTSASWITSATPILSSTFGIGLQHSWTPTALEKAVGRYDGTISVQIKQPLRVESGTLSLTMPTANAYGRDSLKYSVRTLTPTPTGRELEFATSYELQSSKHLSLRTGISLIREPGHVRSARPVGAFEFGATIRF